MNGSVSWQVPCPRCLAAVGEPCVTPPSGRPLTASPAHGVRWAAFHAKYPRAGRGSS